MKIFPTLLLLAISCCAYAFKKREIPLTLCIKNTTSIPCAIEIIRHLEGGGVIIDNDDKSFIRFTQITSKIIEPEKDEFITLNLPYPHDNIPDPHLIAYPADAQEKGVKNPNLPQHKISLKHTYFQIIPLDVADSSRYPLLIRSFSDKSLKHLCITYINTHKTELLLKSKKNRTMMYNLPQELQEQLCIEPLAKEIVNHTKDSIQEKYEIMAHQVKKFFKKDI